MALKRYWWPSPSYSPGAIGSDPRLLCLHTTEGARDNDSIKNFLCGHNGVSYHASVDNLADNVAYEYVYEQDGAWAQCGANSHAVCLVMCTPSGASAGWSADYWWNEQSRMMHNAARWLAEESAQHGIPLVALTSSQAQGSGRGVCEHQHLGSWGCGHSDCGALPLDKLLALAKDYGGGTVGGPEEPPAAAGPGVWIREDESMAPIKGLVTEPVPSWANRLLLASDPGYQGASHVKVRVARYDVAGRKWPVATMDCSAGYPLQEVNVADYEIVSLEMVPPGPDDPAPPEGGLVAGYRFDPEPIGTP
jgi:hypothetical protein